MDNIGKNWSTAKNNRILNSSLTVFHCWVLEKIYHKTFFPPFFFLEVSCISRPDLAEKGSRSVWDFVANFWDSLRFLVFLFHFFPFRWEKISRPNRKKTGELLLLRNPMILHFDLRIFFLTSLYACLQFTKNLCYIWLHNAQRHLFIIHLKILLLAWRPNAEGMRLITEGHCCFLGWRRTLFLLNVHISGEKAEQSLKMHWPTIQAPRNTHLFLPWGKGYQSVSVWHGTTTLCWRVFIGLQKAVCLKQHKEINHGVGCHPKHLLVYVLRLEQKTWGFFWCKDGQSPMAFLGEKFATQTRANHSDWCWYRSEC